MPLDTRSLGDPHSEILDLSAEISGTQKSADCQTGPDVQITSKPRKMSVKIRVRFGGGAGAGGGRESTHRLKRSVFFFRLNIYKCLHYHVKMHNFDWMVILVLPLFFFASRAYCRYSFRYSARELEMRSDPHF